MRGVVVNDRGEAQIDERAAVQWLGRFRVACGNLWLLVGTFAVHEGAAAVQWFRRLHVACGNFHGSRGCGK